MTFGSGDFDHLMALANYRRELRESRLKRLWQVLLAVWAVLIGAFLKADDLPVWLLTGLAVVAFVVTCGWAQHHWARDEQDIRLMHGWSDEAAKLLEPGYAYAEPPGVILKRADQLLQVAITAALCIGLLVAAWGPRPQTSSLPKEESKPKLESTKAVPTHSAAAPAVQPAPTAKEPPVSAPQRQPSPRS